MVAEEFCFISTLECPVTPRPLNPGVFPFLLIVGKFGRLLLIRNRKELLRCVFHRLFLEGFDIFHHGRKDEGGGGHRLGTVRGSGVYRWTAAANAIGVRLGRW